MKEKISHISIISIGVLSLIILVALFVKYLLPVLSPFIISLIIASLTVRPARSLSAKTNTPERVIRLIMSVIATFIFFSGVVLIVWWMSTSLWGFLADIGEGNRLYGILSTIFSTEASAFGGLFPPDLADKISSAVGEIISGCLSRLAEWITSLASGLPQLFLFVLVTLISLVYFSLDYDKIAALITSVLPPRITDVIKKFRNSTLSVIKKYISSYLLILLMTYAIMLTGLWILRVEHVWVIALLIAVLDILPVLGVGTVLIPWSIFSFAEGNRALGIGLILLFVANAIIRQLAEPKIVGKSLNLHPIITLMMIYVGLSLFGIFGAIILPVIAVSIGAILKRDDSAEVT